jgi:hypothetical protein
MSSPVLLTAGAVEYTRERERERETERERMREKYTTAGDLFLRVAALLLSRERFFLLVLAGAWASLDQSCPRPPWQ